MWPALTFPERQLLQNCEEEYGREANQKNRQIKQGENGAALANNRRIIVDILYSHTLRFHLGIYR